MGWIIFLFLQFAVLLLPILGFASPDVLKSKIAITCSDLLGANISVDDWLKDPDLTGHSLMPKIRHVRFFVQDEDHPNETAITFSIVRQSELRSDLQQLAKDLRRRSKTMTIREAEWGAFVAHYKKRKSRAIIFSSRRRKDGMYSINGDDMITAINSSNIFSNRFNQEVLSAIHLHTHPDIRNTRLEGRASIVIPSLFDFEFWVGIRKQLRLYHTNPTFEAIVIPNGRSTSDTVFIVDDTDLDRYLERR